MMHVTLPQSAPVVTGYGKLVMAEFHDTESPNESFSFDKNQERYSLCALKAHGLPRLSWEGDAARTDESGSQSGRCVRTNPANERHADCQGQKLCGSVIFSRCSCQKVFPEQRHSGGWRHPSNVSQRGNGGS